MTAFSAPRRPGAPAAVWRASARYVWLAAFVSGVTVLSLKLEEQYPFSHFPMYGNPGRRAVDYYFLTDSAGNPLPVAELAGDTAPKLKKRLNTLLNDYIEDQRRQGRKIRTKNDIPDGVRAQFAEGVLSGFVQQSKDHGTPLPDRVQLWRGDIRPTPAGYSETFTMEASN